MLGFVFFLTDGYLIEFIGISAWIWILFNFFSLLCNFYEFNKISILIFDRIRAHYVDFSDGDVMSKFSFPKLKLCFIKSYFVAIREVCRGNKWGFSDDQAPFLFLLLLFSWLYFCTFVHHYVDHFVNLHLSHLVHL